MRVLELKEKVKELRDEITNYKKENEDLAAQQANHLQKIAALRQQVAGLEERLQKKG